MTKRKTSIIILTWNGLDYTKMCLNSLKSSALSYDCNVFVVDNGSSDGTLEYLRKIDWITLIENGENLGFVRGNNIAIEKIEEGDIVLLNNDIIVTQNNWLEELQKTAYEDNETGVVGCRLVNEKGELLHAGTYIYSDTYWGQQIGGGQKDVGQYGSNRRVQGVVFACAYIKREVINKVGKLNESFFSYFEDTDYCLATIKAGYNVVCCGKVTLVHYQNISTNVNNVNFSDMFKKSQKEFKKIWNEELESRYNRRMSWHSIMNFSTGYAVSARNYMMALDRSGVDVRYKYVYGKGSPYPLEEPENCDNYIMNMIRNRRFINDCPQVVYGHATVFHKNTGKYKIGFTMLETTGIPKDWVKQCNAMDEIWVPSSFNVETFRNSGVKKPIYIIPLGIDSDFYNLDIKAYKKHNKFTFLSVFEWGERKAPELLLKAFCKAFEGKKDVMLMCKINNVDAGIDIKEQIRSLNLSQNGPDIVFIYNAKFADYDMATLYRSADCFVLPTRGEGWGMPILEAMACGLPVIATNWSAQTDFYNEENGYPIEVEQLVDAQAKCDYYKGFQWAAPSEEHLIERMRYVYENQAEAQIVGRKASEEVKRYWTWDRAAEKIVDRLHDIECE